MTAGSESLAHQAVDARPSRFTGRYPGKVDAKGRIVVPPEFRAQLGKPELFLFPSLIEPVLQGGDERLVDDLLDALSGLDVYDEERWVLEEEITSGVMRLGIDDTGRASVPKDLRTHGGLEGSIAFAGRGQHFILARTDYLDARREAARAAALKNRETLKARTLPSITARRTP
ncbi:MAG: hypothetical protein AAF788_00515 [Pseudomonadota bacterium]